MKKIILFVLLACMLASGMFIQKNKQLKDGLYLVDKILYDTHAVSLNPNQALVPFNRDFTEVAADNSTGLIINTADFVPLTLQDEPVLLLQTETKKKLQLTFSQQAAEKLEQFTGRNVMKQAAIVVGGEALTIHKIRDKIHGNKMEITGGGDDALRRIYATLKNHNVEKH